MRKFSITVVISLVLLLSSVGVSAAPPGGGLDRAIAVQERNNARLLSTPGVVGTAVGLADGNAVIQVFTDGAGVPGIPAVLEGVPVKIQVTGKINAIGPVAGKGKTGGLATTDKWPRPVPIGISTGNANEVSAGTISARVKDAAGNVYALSNNHVYARENAAAIGEEVLQPGRYDTTGYVYDPSNHLGNLSNFVNIVMDGVTPNQVDAAIASTDTTLLGNSTPSSGYGTPKSATVNPQLGMAVQKFGRTSKLTKGTITGINASIKVGYNGGTALFTNQIVVQSNKPFLKAGDSGSLLVGNPAPSPVGLLFAANSAGNYAIANDINIVLAALGISIDGAP